MMVKLKGTETQLNQFSKKKNNELRFKYYFSNVHNGKFNSFLNDVCIDKKWYDLTRIKETYCQQ